MTLKKILLKEKMATQLSDKEMKLIVGGSNKVCRGNSPTCSGDCSYGGVTGTCGYSTEFDQCECRLKA